MGGCTTYIIILLYISQNLSKIFLSNFKWVLKYILKQHVLKYIEIEPIGTEKFDLEVQHVFFWPPDIYPVFFFFN